MRFDILTLFPEFFRGPFDYGVLGRAVKHGSVTVHLHNLRDYTIDRHRTVDDRPFGGGEGMVLKPEPIFAAADALALSPKQARDPRRESVVLLSAGGSRFTQADARELAQMERVALLCGRYEGVDERVSTLLCDRELSIGDYVLSGGELGAALIVDAVSRLVPGVLGHADSSRFESFSGADDGREAVRGASPEATLPSAGLLDTPHYTRPAVFHGVAVPEPLVNGDHAAVRQWRRRAALERTLRFRPDLLPAATLSAQDKAFLEELGWIEKTP